MKAIKTLFNASPPPSLKSIPCRWCKKKFKPTEPGALYCSVNCSRAPAWVDLNAKHSEQLRHRRPTPPPPDLRSFIQEVIKSSQPPSRLVPSDDGAHPSVSASPTRQRTKSLVPILSKDGTAMLSRKPSIPELNCSAPTHSNLHTIPPPARPYLSTSARSRTAQPPHIQIPPRRYSATGGRERLLNPQDEGFSEASYADDMTLLSVPSPRSATPSGTSTAESVVTDSPRYMLVPSDDPDSPNQAGLYASSSPNLLPAASNNFLFRNPTPVDARSVATVTGVSATPFLTRKPSRQVSVAPRNVTSPSTTTVSALVAPHPRYPDNTLRLRPGFERCAPRPRSQSFGGFQVAPFRAH